MFLSEAVDNNEYFSLDVFNDDSVESTRGSDTTPPSSVYCRDSFRSSSSVSSSPSRKGFYDKPPAPPPPGVMTSDNRPKAIVVFDNSASKQQGAGEVSLGKSQIVSVLEANSRSEWWKVEDNLGRQGFYPSHYLRMI